MIWKSQAIIGNFNFASHDRKKPQYLTCNILNLLVNWLHFIFVDKISSPVNAMSQLIMKLIIRSKPLINHIITWQHNHIGSQKGFYKIPKGKETSMETRGAQKNPHRRLQYEDYPQGFRDENFRLQSKQVIFFMSG